MTPFQDSAFLPPSEQARLATLISFSKLPLPASDEKVYLGLEVLSFVFIATVSGKVEPLLSSKYSY